MKSLVSRSKVSVGFTLIELLVVIAIIGILASLLLPGMSRAKMRARNVACINQLRQLGMAVRMYADEHEQRLPAAELLPSMPLDPASPLPRICDVLGPYVGKAHTGTNTTPAMVFKCPADQGRSYTTEGSSYEWNAELNGRRIDETRTTSLHLVQVKVVEGQEVLRKEEDKPVSFPPETTPLMLDYEENHPRPPKPGKNIVFMDGHVTGLIVPALPE